MEDLGSECRSLGIRKQTSESPREMMRDLKGSTLAHLGL